jgi:hypothetical protein
MAKISSAKLRLFSVFFYCIGINFKFNSKFIALGLEMQYEKEFCAGDQNREMQNKKIASHTKRMTGQLIRNERKS